MTSNVSAFHLNILSKLMLRCTLNEWKFILRRFISRYVHFAATFFTSGPFFSLKNLIGSIPLWVLVTYILSRVFIFKIFHISSRLYYLLLGNYVTTEIINVITVDNNNNQLKINS